MGLEHNKGLHNGISHHALSGLRATPPRFNQEQQLLVDQELQKLLDKGVIVQLKTVLQSSFLSTLFLVPKKDGNLRPVINQKCLNTFVVSPHFKMEGIQTFKNLVNQVSKGGPEGHILLYPIHWDHRKYLRLTMRGKTYQSTCPQHHGSLPRSSNL